MKKCSHKDCSRPASPKAGKGLCNAHYHRLKIGAPLDGPIQDRGAGWISSHGYRYIGERAEHRLVVERALGRTLKFNEVVHHADGDNRNNRPSNLVVMDRGECSRLHTRGKSNEQRAKERATYGRCLAGPVRP